MPSHFQVKSRSGLRASSARQRPQQKGRPTSQRMPDCSVCDGLFTSCCDT